MDFLIFENFSDDQNLMLPRVPYEEVTKFYISKNLFYRNLCDRIIICPNFYFFESFVIIFIIFDHNLT